MVQSKEIFPVPDLLPITMHLGHPIIFNHRDRNKAYEFILNKFRAKLTTVKANKLNHSGRLTYIKSVLASIPVYYMSTVLFSKSFVRRITAIIRKFWWTGVQEDSPTSPIAYRFWDDICQPKENGGLAVLKAKYYPNSSFWTAISTGNSSIWSTPWCPVWNNIHDHMLLPVTQLPMPGYYGDAYCAK